MSDGVLGASFRDPSGFVFRRGGEIFRQVNQACARDYDQLMSSGLYRRLCDRRLLVEHEEVDAPVARSEGHYRTLRPEPIDFISYPYEWCFSQLQDAALVTLRVQLEALAAGMVLKDASAYNVQFQRGRPLLIDTLSFERYEEGGPWVGYRQFCQHFLAPLALMSLRDVRMLQLMRVHLDGVPLDLATSLLPRRSWLRLGLLTNIRLHAGAQKRHDSSGDVGRETEPPRVRPLSKSAHENLIKGLEQTIRSLAWKPEGTEWADYYEGDSYEAHSLDHKKALVGAALEAIRPQQVWDLGANTGVYSRIAAEQGARVVSFDVDPACVERSYRQLREGSEERVLPLLLDLANPSPAIGWANRERDAISERGRPDAILALALVHHIAISNNVPLERIADYLADLAPHLVIEFVPKSDAKLRTLLATREDIFPSYTQEGFEAAFSARWKIEDASRVEGSERTLYRLSRSA